MPSKLKWEICWKLVLLALLLVRVLCFALVGVQTVFKLSFPQPALLHGAHSGWDASYHALFFSCQLVYICICLDTHVYFYTWQYTYDNSGWGRVLNVWSFSLIRVPASLKGEALTIVRTKYNFCFSVVFAFTTWCIVCVQTLQRGLHQTRAGYTWWHWLLWNEE